MNSQTMIVETVTRRPTGQLVVRVVPPAGVDLQFIYCAASSISWNPDELLLEDCASKVENADSSAARISRALHEEYRITLRPSGNIQWDGLNDEERAQVASALFR